jgi:2-polyprenyl-3-methyl-5-hydroxy-6-metoxy-1,4-benzoquinol methylase
MQLEYAESYANLYREHWWWRSRERILIRAIRKIPLPAPATILDVGCGDGLFFSKLREFGEVEGIETDASLVRTNNPDRQRIYSQPLGDQAYADASYDLITALDVLEHIKDDRAAVGHMISMLKPGGFLLVTVPAFMVLWDEHDEANHHVRRYTAAALQTLLSERGELLDIHYLYHAIFIPKYIVTRLNKLAPRKLKQSAMPPRPINQAMSLYCDWEERMLGRARLPFGTSVMALVQRARL